MKGFVLAAGFGTRLSPLTQTVPKPMFPVGQVPLIGYALKLLAYHGITDVVVNLHHLGNMVRGVLGDGAAYGVQVTYSDEQPEILDTGGGLKKMASVLDDTFVAVNSDTILDIDLHAVIEAHKNAGALATMILRRDPAQGAYGQIEVDAESRIRRIVGHAKLGTAPAALTPYMFTGVHILEPRFLDYLPEGPSSVVRAGYMRALDHGEVLRGFVTDGYWVDAGTPPLYFNANRELLTGRLRVRSVQGLPQERSPGIYVHASAAVDASAKLIAPVAIAANVEVGAGAIVGPNVVLGSGSIVAAGAFVTSSVILNDVRVGAERVVEEIVGKKARIGIYERANS
ncbi:MAG: NDP-sugar synthase [Clostridia bacterium]|nr:NDP-sugar synthase [Deltaproteobacteria bacterium]